MFNIGEYRKKPDRLADLLPWAALVAPGVVLNKDGSFQRTFSYRGPDLDSATESELTSVAARVNNVFKRLTAGWAMWAEAQRMVAREYPLSTFENPLAYLIDEERRASFQNNTHFESAYYLTLLYLPPSEQKSRLAGLFLENQARNSVDYHAHLGRFIDETNRIFDLMYGIFPEIHPLDDKETLTYLHGAISPKRHPVRVPEIPMYLDALLPDSPLVGGLAPRLGETPIKVISVLGYPGQSVPGLLDGLNRLAIEYRWSTRFICMDKTDALTEIAKYKKRWFAKRKSVLVLIKEGITNQESAMSDSDAENKAYDADAAYQELAGDYVSYGYFTANVVLWDLDPEQLQAKARGVEQVINGLGFVTIDESMNAVDAWLGSLPGHARANVRRPLLNTLNLAHLMPLSAVWAGPAENKHLAAPVLMHATTSGNTPFRCNLHVGDVGHTMICGPTGAGKDVLMATLQVQFLRYRNSQIYIFDKGGSSRVITAGLGGDFYELGSGGGNDDQLAFQPLSGVHEERERTWASQWVLDVLQQENVTVTPRIKAELWGTLTSLATTPPEQRTISGFIALSQNQTVRQALFPYCVDGPLGHIFDATTDTLNYSRWQVFEMEELMASPAAVVPALSYLFHRLEQRFSAAVPTLLFLNEAWLFFDSPAFAPRIREWLKTLRKLNVAVIFATQGLTDIESCPISAALIESCPTRIFLPNDRAMEEETARVYRRFGLNDRQIQMLAVAQPKRQYYYQSALGNRLFELGLGPLGLAFCAATSKEDQILAKRVLAEQSEARFAASWLSFKGIPWAAEILQGRSPSASEVHHV